MSAPVDVLVVLDRAYRAAVETGGPANDLREARAAVAELVEKARMVADWIADYVPDDVAGRQVEERELRAALARVGGAS